MQYATLISNGKNSGVSGSINVWSPEVAADQLSDASVYVAADDGSLINGLASGWAVPYFFLLFSLIIIS